MDTTADYTVRRFQPEQPLSPRLAAAQAVAQFDQLDSPWMSCSQISRQLQVPDALLQPAWATPAAPEPPQGDEAELRRALEAHHWNASRTARALGISRTTLWRKMRRFALLPRA